MRGPELVWGPNLCPSNDNTTQTVRNLQAVSTLYLTPSTDWDWPQIATNYELRKAVNLSDT